MNKEKEQQAYNAIAAANPRWGPRFIKYAIHIMPTSLEWIYPHGSAQRELARQHFIASLHQWMVEVNLMDPEKAYKLPDGWRAPWGDDAPKVREQRIQRGTTSSTAEQKVVADIKEPRAGSAGAQAWTLCDELYEKHGRAPTPAEARDLATQRGLNPGNVGTEMSRWRKFRGYAK